MRKLEDPDSKPAVGAGGGSHIVLPGYYSPQARVGVRVAHPNPDPNPDPNPNLNPNPHPNPHPNPNPNLYYSSPQGMGLADLRTSRGAFLFFLPWKGHTVVGTTDSKSPAQTSPGK